MTDSLNGVRALKDPASKQPSCDACQWGQETQVMPQTVSRVRFCHRFPPVPLIAPNGAMTCAFPMVGDKAYCGEWVAAPWHSQDPESGVG